MKEIYVETVRVDGRHRRDLGDLTDLVRSIEQVGLMHPITVTASGYLIAGQRRLEAFRKLGRDRIQARVITDLTGAVERLEMERDENTARKAMVPEELVSLGKALEALERPKARERRDGQLRQNRSGQLTGTETDRPTGETTDIVANAIGMSPTTYKRARAVVDAAGDPEASAEDRERAAAALAEMNETGKVIGPYEKVMGIRPADSNPRSTNPRGRLARGAASRQPLPDFANKTGWAIRKEAEKLERIAADDRLTENKDVVAAHLRGHLHHTVKVCQDLLARLDKLTGA